MKIVRTIVTFLLFLVVGSVIVSFFMNEEFTTTEVQIPKASTTLQNRLQQTLFALPLADMSGYNYSWLQNRFEGEKEKNWAYIAVDANFMYKLGIYAVVFDMNTISLLQSDYSLLTDRVQTLANYYNSVKLPDRYREDKARQVTLAQVILLSLDYAANSPSVRQALLNQLKAATILMKDNNLPYRDVVLPAGYLPADIQKNYGNFATRYSLTQLARNIFESQRQLEREMPDNRIRLLLINSPWESQATRLGLTLEDLRIVYDELLRLNSSLGNPIIDYPNRVGIALDMSALYSVWLTKESPYYKDENRLPLSQAALTEKILTTLLVKNPTGNVKHHLVKSIYASYFLGSEESYNQPSLYLPYTRAPIARSALNQLKLTTDIFAQADIGLGNGGTVVLYMPRRELFPLLHRLAKPLAKRWGFYLKPDGSDGKEQLYSLSLLRDYLNFNLR